MERYNPESARYLQKSKSKQTIKQRFANMRERQNKVTDDGESVEVEKAPRLP